MTGENDMRTPISEAEQFYRALKAVGVETALVRLLNGSHGYFRGRADWLWNVQYHHEWFERYTQANKNPRAH